MIWLSSRRVFALFLVALTLPCVVHGQELHIAAASDLTPVMPRLAAAYEAEKHVKLVTSFGSSATLAQQLENGAPQDVFLAADYLHPETLVGAHMTVETAPVPYARGVLVIWARKDSPAQPLSLDSLTKPGVQKIAIANELHAPYGMAAVAAIKRLGLTDKIAGKLVVAENIMQTAQYAESGNAQMAFISLTIASSPHFAELGTYVRMPHLYSSIEQCAVVMKASKNQKAALDFVAWLTSAPVQAKLKSFGLDPVN